MKKTPRKTLTAPIRRVRFVWVAFFFCLWIAAIVVRLAWLQVGRHAEFAEKAQKQQEPQPFRPRLKQHFGSQRGRAGGAKQNGPYPGAALEMRRDEILKFQGDNRVGLKPQAADICKVILSVPIALRPASIVFPRPRLPQLSLIRIRPRGRRPC